MISSMRSRRILKFSPTPRRKGQFLQGFLRSNTGDHLVDFGVTSRAKAALAALRDRVFLAQPCVIRVYSFDINGLAGVWRGRYWSLWYPLW